MSKTKRNLTIALVSILLFGAIYGLFFHRRVGFKRLWRLGEVNQWIDSGEWVVVDTEWLVSEISLYNPKTKRYRILETPEIGFSYNATLSNDGSLLAYTDDFENLRIVEVSSGEIIYTFNDQMGWPIAFSPDHSKLVTWKQNEIYLLDLQEKTEKLILQIDREIFDDGLRVGSVEWKPHSDEIAYVADYEQVSSGSKEDYIEIHLFDLVTIEDQTIIFIPDNHISDLKWSPDGNYLAYAYGDYNTGFGINVFDLLNDCPVLDIETTGFSKSVWSPDGKSLIYEFDWVYQIFNFEEELGVPYNELPCLGE